MLDIPRYELALCNMSLGLILGIDGDWQSQARTSCTLHGPIEINERWVRRFGKGYQRLKDRPWTAGIWARRRTSRSITLPKKHFRRHVLWLTEAIRQYSCNLGGHWAGVGQGVACCRLWSAWARWMIVLGLAGQFLLAIGLDFFVAM